MPKFMAQGGIGMWFILLFGGVTLLSAILFARRPHESRMGMLRALTVTTLLSSFTAFTAGVAMSLGALGRVPPEAAGRVWLLAAKGVSESAANLILGSVLLTWAWLVIAIGQRRLAAAEAKA
jgi:hypothetical protein